MPSLEYQVNQLKARQSPPTTNHHQAVKLASGCRSNFPVLLYNSSHCCSVAEIKA